jgi:methylmalonic aciduria homocystinuria type C protein
MTPSGEAVTIAFGSACARRGFDLAMPFPVSAFNAAALAEERLPDMGRQDALAILIGNTRSLWSVFRTALAQDRRRLEVAHPLDEYVTESVTDAASRTGVRHELRWGHAMHPRPIPIQRIAQQIGLAALSPSHLSVHPEFGPWIALRAVAVFDVAGPAFSARPSTQPCDACARPCLAALEKALGPRGPRSPDAIRIGTDWEQWLAVRDACPVGTAHRYSRSQIAYHYTKSTSLLTDV